MSEEKLPGLVIDVEARITKLERSLQKANDAQKKAAAQMEARARASAEKIGAAYAKVGDGATRGFASLGTVFKENSWRIGGAATQFGDLATQIGGGTSALKAFGMQAGQIGGYFGPAGMIGGAAAAAIIPLVSALLNAGDEAGTLKDRLDELKISTDAMASAVETAATPVEELRLKYRDLADEVARAGGVMAGFAAARAKRDALGAAHSLSGELGIDLNPPEAPRQWDGSVNRERARIVELQRQKALDTLKEKTGAAGEQVERLAQALRRVDTSNDLDAVVRDSENLLAVLDGLYQGATDEQRGFLEGWAAQVEAVMDAAKRQIAAQTAEDTRLAREYDKNTLEIQRLAADRKAAEEKLTAAKKAGDAEQVASMQRVITAIDRQIAKLNELASTSKSVYEQIVSDAKSAAAEFASGAFEFLTGSTPKQFLDDSRTGEKGILHLIKQKESGGDYNAQWGGGKYSGGPKDFVNMTVREVLAVQRGMLKHPGNDANSSAVGAYQIVGTTLGGKAMDGFGGLVAKLDISLDEQFTPQLQDRLAQELLRQRRSQGVDGLRQEWTALQSVARPVIESALGNEVVPTVDPVVASTRATEADTAARERNKQAIDAQKAAQEQANEAARQSAEAQRQAQEATATGAQAMTDLFMAAGQGADALKAKLLELAQQIVKQQAFQMFAGMPGMGWLGGLLSGGGMGFSVAGGDVLSNALRGTGAFFDRGGWTGPAGTREAVGVVHGQEYVLSAPAVRTLGVANLDRLHEAAKNGYRDGGFVGPARTATAASGQRRASARAPAPVVTINAPVTVNATGGTPEANADLARQVALEQEKALRGLVTHELMRQLRPGGMLR